MKSKMLLVMVMLFMCISGSNSVFAIPFVQENYAKNLDKIYKKSSDYRSYLNQVEKLIDDAIRKIEKGGFGINKDKEKETLQQALNKKNEYGLTPIFYAADFSEYDLIVKMIKYGANLNIASDQDKKTPLFHALENDTPNSRVIKLLVDKGADVNYQVNNSDESSYTPLMAACQTRNKEIIKIILDKATSIDVRSKYKNSDNDDVLMTPFGFLCGKNAYEFSDILMALLDRGVNVNQIRKIGNMERTPFQNMCFNFDKRNIPLMQKMVEKGADVDSVFSGGNKDEIFSPLFCAVENKDKDLVKLILDNGKSFDEKISYNSSGSIWKGSILGYLAQFYNSNSEFDADSVIKRLVQEKGVNINTKIEYKRYEITPLGRLCLSHDSRENDCTEIIKFLLANRADTNIDLKVVWDDDKINTCTALHIVASKNDKNLYKLLKENSGNINLKDSYGLTPIERLRSHIKTNADKFAFDYAETDKANESLIENITNINEKSSDGKTMLQIALFHGDGETARKLIDKGAKWDSPDNADKNAFDYAVENEIYNIIDYFIEKKVNIGKSIFTVIDKVLENGNTNYLEKFLSYGDFSKVTVQFGIGKSKTSVGQIVYAALKNQDDTSLRQNRNRALDALTNAKEKISMEGLNKKEISSDGKTPLVACLSVYSDETTAMTLLQTGAQLAISDNDGKNGIDYAFDKNYSEIIRWMVENNTKIGTAIYNAIDNEMSGGESYIAEFMARENNINENSFDKRKDDPNGSYYVNPIVYTVMSNLETSKEKERIEIIKKLSELGFNVNKSMRGSIYNGNTALMMAVKTNQLEIAKCLIGLGAKADSPNTSTIDSEFKGKTPLFFALKLSDNGEMAKLILNAMEYKLKDVVLNSDDEKGVSLLMYLASYAEFDVMNGILPSFIEQNHNALERKDAKGRTPFLHAVMNNNDEKVMRLFRMYGANIEATDNEGNNAQVLAEYNGNKEIIKAKLEDWGVY